MHVFMRELRMLSKKKKMLSILYTKYIKPIFLILFFWYMIAYVLANTWLFPYPHTIFIRMIQFMFEKDFYFAIMFTLKRVFIASILSIIVAFIFAFLCYYNKKLQYMIRPFILLFRSIPNISYVLIILVFLGNEIGTTMICFFITFPTIFTTIYHALTDIHKYMNFVIQMYPESLFYKIYRVYIPLIKSNLKSSSINAVSLSLKVGIMAEIIGSVNIGIGREMYQCKLFFDMEGLFAWTVWVLLMLLCLEKIIEYIFRILTIMFIKKA